MIISIIPITIMIRKNIIAVLRQQRHGVRREQPREPRRGQRGRKRRGWNAGRMGFYRIAGVKPSGPNRASDDLELQSSDA